MVHPAKQQKAEQSRRAPAKAHGTQQTQKAAKAENGTPRQAAESRAEQQSSAKAHGTYAADAEPSGRAAYSSSSQLTRIQFPLPSFDLLYDLLIVNHQQT